MITGLVYPTPASPFEVRLQASAGAFPLELASDVDSSPTLITMTDSAIERVAEKLGLTAQSASPCDERLATPALDGPISRAIAKPPNSVHLAYR